MKICEILKRICGRFTHWIDRIWGPDRLTVQPRWIKEGTTEIERLKKIKKIYRFNQITNISVTGGKAAGKKSFVKTFEKTRFIPVGKFLHIDFCDYMDENKDLPSFIESVDTFVLECIINYASQGELSGLNDRLVRGRARIYRRPLMDILIGVSMICALKTKDQWLDYLIHYLPATWEPQGIHLAVLLTCGLITFLCFTNLIKKLVAFWPLLWLKVKIAPKNLPAEATIDGNISRRKDRNNIIYAINILRRKIGHTVVFEHLEVLGEEKFTEATRHLCILNKKINEHIKASKQWFAVKLQRPIRFLYIYRDDVVQLQTEDPVFDDNIDIPPKVTADTAFSELKRLFEIEKSHGATFPIDKLYPIDSRYELAVSSYIANRRIQNEIVKKSINTYKDFVDRIEPTKLSKKPEPSENDVRKLFSFVVYKSFFPKEYAKFIDRTSVVFTNDLDKSRVSSTNSELFNFLLSEACPQPFRIDYVCMRYVNPQIYSVEEHLPSYESAIKNNDYKTALVYIERAICCDPTQQDLINKRNEIMEKIKEKDHENCVLIQ